ncbi:unnamed protein product, partial [Porites lobata]
RSPLIQGGLEIPVEVEVQMENSSENQQALSKYQTLVAENYHEPVNGKYVDATPDILKALDCEDELTDFEDEGDEEVDTNTADLDRRNEYNQVAAAVVDLARPQPSQSRSKRSKYVQYSGEDRAKIAKYSCEHGNTKALQHFSKEYPNLKESTLRNFKKAYQDKLKVIQR